MKLIIQIPCYNEEKTLPLTYADLPHEIPGIDTIEYLIINDGSTDRTVEVAKELGIHHIVSFAGNRGLSAAFSAGLKRCLEEGADIIVNTDGDNAFPGNLIPNLVKPIVEHTADVVIGDRETDKVKRYSWVKRKLQRIGTWTVNAMAGTTVNDAVCGFRAYSASAARRINTLSNYSYTTENLIQLGYERLRIVSMPIHLNEDTRKSRLMRSIPHFITNQMVTMVRSYSYYYAMRIYSILAAIMLSLGTLGIIRFVYLYYSTGTSGRVQSLIVSSILITLGIFTFLIGVIADMISTNRKLMEKMLEMMREMNRRAE